MTHHAQELLEEVKRLRQEVSSLEAAYRNATHRYHQAAADLLDHGGTGMTTQQLADELDMARSRLYALREKARKADQTPKGPQTPASQTPEE